MEISVVPISLRQRSPTIDGTPHPGHILGVIERPLIVRLPFFQIFLRRDDKPAICIAGGGNIAGLLTHLPQ